MRAVLPARGLPRRDGLARRQIDREREVLVLEVRVEPAMLGVDREALGVAFERELRLLVERLAVEDPDGLVARRRHPDLLLTRDVGEAIRHRIDLVARALRQRPRVERAHRRVGAIADVDDPVADGHRARPDDPLALAGPHFRRREPGDLLHGSARRIDDHDQSRVARRRPEEAESPGRTRCSPS